MKRPKKLGIIGGMGSRAGCNLFKKIIDYSPAVTDQEFVEVLFHNNSCIPDRTKAILNNGVSPMDEILRSIQLFNKNKIDVIILACNTSYYFFEEFSQYTDSIILHPVDILRRHLETFYPSIKRVGLLATTGTVRTGIYHKELANYGFEVITPNEYDLENKFMRSVYMENGLKSSKVCKEAINLMKSLVPALVDMGAEAIVGGCSEVPLVLNKHNVPVPFLDPMDLLAREAVHFCYNYDNQLVALS